MMPKIAIVPYDPTWPVAFAAEAGRLRVALGSLALRIDHNGSTSVPGMAAKPVIDIQVSVLALDPFDAYRDPLHGIGYTHMPHPDDSFSPFFRRPRDWPHKYHVHVVRAGGDEERRTLAFRDYLREHANEAAEYERLKRALAARFGGGTSMEREDYARAKTHYIEALVARAIASGLPRS